MSTTVLGTDVPLFTSIEASALLGISVDRVRDLAEARKISFFKVGGSLMFSRRQLSEFLESARRERV